MIMCCEASYVLYILWCLATPGIALYPGLGTRLLPGSADEAYEHGCSHVNRLNTEVHWNTTFIGF